MTVAADEPMDDDFESTNPYATAVLEQPWSVLITALERSASNEPISDDLSEACEFASGMLVIAAFVQAGVDFDVATDMIVQRDHAIKVAYDADTDEYSLQVEWLDGEDGPTCVKQSEVGPSGPDHAPIDSAPTGCGGGCCDSTLWPEGAQP